MQSELIHLNFLSLFSLICFFVFLIIQRYSSKTTFGYLLDKDFDKPQSFHKTSIPRSGGLASFISLIIFFFFNYILFNKIYFDYFFLFSLIFLLGFFDDLKIKINPNLRLLLMAFIILFFINLFSINIGKVDLIFLNNFLKNKYFLSIFILLCFLFIINGSNLIDGFNGLLGINLLVINLSILYINLNSTDQNFIIFLIAQIIILTSFLIFNFPRAKIFLGDSGSYLFGAITALNIIYSNNFNPEISSFYFCSLLFYLFFEVFFSFFRKIYQKKSPFKPDNLHLHMLVFKWINRTKKFTQSNYINSIIINLVYCILVSPLIFFRYDGLICKFWFFSLPVFYLLFYYYFYKKNKDEA